MLNVNNLTSGLVAIASPGGFPATYDEAGQAWADTYVAYASGAETPHLAFMVDPSGGKDLLASTLSGVFAAGAPAGAAIAAALTAYWLTPPQAFLGSRPGAVSAVPGTAALAAALEAVIAANITSHASAQDACEALADAIHAFTQTVTVTTPPPGAILIETIS